MGLWRYYRSNPEFTVYAGVWRPVDPFKYILVGVTEFPPTRMGKTTVEVTSPITVLPGDIVGIHHSRSAEAGVVSHALVEDRVVDRREFSDTIAVELYHEDIVLGEVIDIRLYTNTRRYQCISIFAKLLTEL